MASMTEVGSERSQPVSRQTFGERAFELSLTDRLDAVIENEVIPRLLVAHCDPLLPSRTAPRLINAGEVLRFTNLVLKARAHEVLDAVEKWLERGVPLETVFVELLAPAARRMGEGWEDDTLDFIEVTMGLWRLQEVLREVAAASPNPHVPARTARCALCTPMPGDQHSFGSAMLEECFARAGWDTLLLIDATRRDLLAQVADRRFELVALTVSLGSHIEQLPSMVSALRSVSSNPEVKIMIGGCVPLAHPGLAASVGADGTARTAIEAVATAEMLVNFATCTAAA